MDEDKLKINNKSIKILSIFCLLSAIVIDIIHNIKIDVYLRDFIIPLVIMVIGYIFLLLKNKLIKNKKAYYILIPIGLIFISNLLIEVAEVNKFLNIFVLPILISIFFFYLTNKNYDIGRKSIWIFKLFPKGLFSNLKYTNSIFRKKHNKNAFNIFIGLLISIPFTVIILALLSSADRYFGSFISRIIDFKLFTFNKIWNVVIILFVFILLFSVFINIIKNIDTKLETNKDIKNINYTISTTIVTVINLVFLLFLTSEISKLTGNFLQLPIKYTYAEYAREGFFQLLAVSFINFLIIIYHLYFRKGIQNNKLLKYMIMVLIMFSILLIFNSYYRMFLYVNVYSFTILRLQVLLFLTMELIMFSILIFKLFNKIKLKENILYSLILIIFYILNIYLCNSNFISLIN